MAVAKCDFSFRSSIWQIRVAGIEAARCSIKFNAAVAFKLPMNIHNPTWNRKRHAVTDNALGDLCLRKKDQHIEGARRGCKRATMTRIFITKIHLYSDIQKCLCDQGNVRICSMCVCVCDCVSLACKQMDPRFLLFVLNNFSEYLNFRTIGR